MEETVEEEKLPFVQIDVVDQKLGLDIELSVPQTPHYVSDFVTY